MLAKKALAPLAQRRRVVRTDVLEVEDLHVGRARRRRRVSAVTDGMKLPGKHVALDEIDAAQRGLVDLILNRDRLQQHRALRLQQRRCICARYVSRILMADGLDHLDRDQLVVLAGEIAIVVEPQLDAIAQARGGDALAGELVLFPGDRRRRDAAAIVARGVDRESAPAGADLEQMIVGVSCSLRHAASNFAIEASCSVASGRSKMPHEYAMVSSRNSLKKSLPRS